MSELRDRINAMSVEELRDKLEAVEFLLRAERDWCRLLTSVIPEEQYQAYVSAILAKDRQEAKQ